MRSNALPNNFQSIPVHSDMGNLNSTVFQGYDPNICPLIGEIQLYEASNATNALNRTLDTQMAKLFTLFQTKGLNLTGYKVPSDLLIEDYKAIIQEIRTAQLELRPMKFTFTAEEEQLMRDFLSSYYHQYLQGNDTVTQLSVTDFFSSTVELIDTRIRGVAHDGSAPAYILKQKYNYLGLNDQAIVAILAGFGIRDPAFVPEPTSSLFFELYQIKGDLKTTDRSNYYVKLVLDDKNLVDKLLATGKVVCELDQGACSWDSLAKFMLERRISTDFNGKQTTLHDMCFSHLHIVMPPDNRTESVPWWLAIVISIPLVVITLSVIKIGLIMHEKKQREELQRK